MWYIEYNEACGRWYVIRGYYADREVWTNSYGAGDHITKEEAQARADILNRS